MKLSIRATLTLCGILALSPVNCKSETKIQPSLSKAQIDAVDFWSERKNDRYSPRSNPNNGWSSLVAPQTKQEYSVMCFYDEPKCDEEKAQDDVSP